MNEKMIINQLIDEYGDALNLCCKELTKNTVFDEISLEYAIVRIYSRVIMSCREVYFLLREGYPHGALTISRQVFEGLVIIDTLLSSTVNGNTEIVERFFDAAEIRNIQHQIDMARFGVMLSNDDFYQTSLNEFEDRLEKYKQKYPEVRFRDYWWAGCNTFADLANLSRIKKNHMYNLESMNTHLNACSVLNYLDPLQEKIIIAESEIGIEESIWHTALWMTILVKVVYDKFPQFVSEETFQRFHNLEQHASSCKRGLIQKQLKNRQKYSPMK